MALKRITSLAGLALCAATCFGDVDLNGVWEFRFEEDRAAADVADPAFTATDRISVPGCYDMMPKWLCKRGTGLYRRKFTLDRAVDNPKKDKIVVASAYVKRVLAKYGKLNVVTLEELAAGCL